MTTVTTPNLAAAAPDLLAALQAVLPLLDIVWNHDGDVFGRSHNDAVDADAMVRAAIAKALAPVATQA